MNTIHTDLIFDPELIRKFDVNGPRYTSYPTADRFVEAFNSTALCDWLGQRAIGGVGKPLSIILPHPVLQYDLLLLRLQQDHHQGSRPLGKVPGLP